MNSLALIVPIYNVEAYLDECLHSIVESIRGRGGVHVLLIDDGSEDRSGEIAWRFANEYDFFSYHFKENGGLSDARNFGLEKAEALYVAFLDSDDYLSADYFDEICAAIEEKPDLIVFDWFDVNTSGQKKRVKGMDVEDCLWTVLPSSCSKVFRRSLFDNIEFPVGLLYEDVATTYKILKDIKRNLYIQKELYYYRKNREGSLLTTITPSINDIYVVLEDVIRFYKTEKAWTQENKEGLGYQAIKLLLWSNMYRQLKFYKFRFLPFYQKMQYTRKLIYRHFPDWKKNGYLHSNRTFFEERIGTDYIKRLDDLGKGFWSTLSFAVVVVAKNRNR